MFRLSIALVMITALVAQAPPPAPSAALADGWFVTSDSVRLHYLSGGSGPGPAIIFVPGWTMPAEIWEPQLEYFARSHQVIALDPRSQGASQRATEGNFVDRRAQDIHELMRHLGQHHVVLVGWSLGVVEILQVIERFGTGDVAGLVLVDGLIWVTPNSNNAAFFDSALVGMLRDRRTFTAAFVRGMYRTHQDPAYLARITRAALSTPTATAYTLMASAYAVGPRDWRPALSHVHRPVLFVGTGFTRETADTVRARVPGTRVEILGNAGHAVFVDEPERFNRILESFLQGLR